MTAGIIFVIAILMLGGLIAVVSDRLGMKVGKARLSLFKLRPRQTAAVVAIMTGTVLSGLTLGILFTASKPLRRGVFQMDQIQERLNQTRKDLTQTSDERNRVKTELALASAKLKKAQSQLQQINQSLDATNTEAVQTETELKNAQQQLQQAQSQLNQLQEQLTGVEGAKADMEAELTQTEAQLQQVSQQKQTLESEIQQLKEDRAELMQQREQVQAQIQQRDQEIKAKDEVIEQRDRVIMQRENTLQALETERQELEQQTTLLKQQLNLIGRNLKLLREGSVGLKRGQILASVLVQTQDQRQSQIIVDRILQTANRMAINSVQLGNVNAEKERVIQIPKAEVEALIDQIDDGRDYVIQVVSSANYLVGEKRVDVFTKVEPNRLLFTSGEVIAKNSLNPANLTNDQLEQRLQEIIDASQFRARYVGVIEGLTYIGDNSTDTILSFVQQLQSHQQTIELQAVAAQDTYTIGPLKIDLLARQNGTIVFSTREVDLKPKTQPLLDLESPKEE